MKQTRKAIQDAYIDLCSRKPADKITVKEVVEECGINRNSFYYHFEDLPNLAVSIAEDIVQTTFAEYADEDFFTQFLAFAREFQEHLNFFRNIYFSKNREVLDIRFQCLVRDMITNYMVKNVFPQYDLSEEDQEIIIQTYVAEFTSVFFTCLQSGMKYDLPTRLARMVELRRGTLERMVKRADRSGRYKDIN